MRINIEHCKRCAFCKYWQDPVQQYIRPVSTSQNLWEYDNSAQCQCLRKNIKMVSGQNCAQYECKVPLQTKK